MGLRRDPWFRLLVVGVALVELSCAGSLAATAMEHWDASANFGILSAELCAVCSGPYEFQVDRAKTQISEACGQHGYVMVEEGTILKPEYAALVKRRGGAGFAGSRYFWVFSCSRNDRPEP